MDMEYLQNYIEEHIPIVKVMKFKIIRIEDGEIITEAPYKDHINHRDSVFGGSIESLMTLAGWAKVRVMMERIDKKATIVIQESRVKFFKPVLDDFIAYSIKDDEKVIEKFEKIYTKFRKGRITIKVFLRERHKEETLAEFEGEFVVVGEK